MVRGLLPVLATPSPSGDALLEETIAMAGRMGVVGPSDYVVVVQRLNHDFCVKILAVDDSGTGIKQQPSLVSLSSRLSLSLLGVCQPLPVPRPVLRSSQACLLPPVGPGGAWQQLLGPYLTLWWASRVSQVLPCLTHWWASREVRCCHV